MKMNLEPSEAAAGANDREDTDSNRSGALPETLRRSLVRARETHGLKHVLRATLTAEGTHWRAEAGGNVYHGTVLAIERGLAQLEGEAP
jgi:hypothetical protein